MRYIIFSLLMLTLALSFAWGQQFDPNNRSPNICLDNVNRSSSECPSPTNCGMQLGGPVIFCDTFSEVNPGTPSRTGALDPNVWGVSRLSQYTNLGQQEYNVFPPVYAQTCNGTMTVSVAGGTLTNVAQVAPDNDVMICNGQLREAVNDNLTGILDTGEVVMLAMYPKQPFDFAGRTGTVSFDVSNDTHSGHAAWPEFWITDLPIPAPFVHFAGPFLSIPQNGFGLRLDGGGLIGQQGTCPTGANLGVNRWTIESAVIVNNWVADDTLNGTHTAVLTILGCVINSPDNSGIMNHVEVRVSQTQIDVYATDAGTTSPLVHIASITNINLGLTRGLVWMNDVHYNADKAYVDGVPQQITQSQHTFYWDNLAFDGPFTFRDFSFDSLDALTPFTGLSAISGSVALGQVSAANAASSWNVLNMPSGPNPAAVRVLFNFFHEVVPTTINVTVNGHAHSVAWPYPDSLTPNYRTLAVTIPVTDLVTGTNVVQIGADQQIATSSVNIVLANVPGGVPVLPGNSRVYPTSCSLTAPAFCDNFNQASAVRGRGGDLDPTKWATARISGDEIMGSALGVANPVLVAQIPRCRTGIPPSSMYPPNDTLICDSSSSGGHTGQLMSAAAMQNYGVNSYMPRQPFDFAGRTGKIDFDVDAFSLQNTAFIEIEVTQDPEPATTFREANNDETGPIPRNAISIRFAFASDNGCNGVDVAPYHTMVYNNYVGTIITPTFDHANGCAAVNQGSLNHFEIQLSQSHVDVYGSDFAHGSTFPNYKLLYSADISLPFTRGYVHFNNRNHATIKYFNLQDSLHYWDNLGFDGPVLPVPRAYEITDNTSNNGSIPEAPTQQIQNLGWQLLDGTTGPPAGMYDPVNKVNALTFQNVNISGISSATLTFNFFFGESGLADTTWGLSYRFNGGTLRTVNLTSAQITGFSDHTTAPQHILGYVISVATGDLVQGNNTIEFLPINLPMNYPPVITNIDLLVQ